MQEFIRASVAQEKFVEIKQIIIAFKNKTQSENTDSLIKILEFYRDEIEKYFAKNIKGVVVPED